MNGTEYYYMLVKQLSLKIIVINYFKIAYRNLIPNKFMIEKNLLRIKFL